MALAAGRWGNGLVPHIITLPGTRDGADNVFAQQDLTTTTATTEIAMGARVYSSLFRTYWTDHSGASVVNWGRIWNIAPGNTTDLTTQLSGIMLLEAMAELKQLNLVD